MNKLKFTPLKIPLYRFCLNIINVWPLTPTFEFVIEAVATFAKQIPLCNPESTIDPHFIGNKKALRIGQGCGFIFSSFCPSF